MTIGESMSFARENFVLYIPGGTLPNEVVHAPNIKVVSFDLGNVLSFWTGVHEEHYASLELEKYGKSQRDFDVALGNQINDWHEGRINEQIMWKRVCSELGVPYDGRTFFKENLWKVLERNGTNLPLLRVVGQAREAGYKTIMITNAEAEHIEWHDKNVRNKVEDGKKPYDVFDQIFTARDPVIRSAKSKPEIFQYAARTMGVPLENMVHADDNKGTCQVASTAGAYAIHHIDNPTTVRTLNQLLNREFSL